MLPKPEILIIDLIRGALFLIVGICFIMHRKRIAEALVASNKVFRERLNFLRNYKMGSESLNKIMIPLIGIGLAIAGFCLVVKVAVFSRCEIPIGILPSVVLIFLIKPTESIIVN